MFQNILYRYNGIAIGTRVSLVVGSCDGSKLRMTAVLFNLDVAVAVITENSHFMSLTWSSAGVLRLFGSSANIQQWASPFTAGVSWLSGPDQLTRLQTTST